MANRIPIECTDRAGRRSIAPVDPRPPQQAPTRSRNVDATSSAASTSPSRSNQPVVATSPRPRAGAQTLKRISRTSPSATS